MLEATKFQNLQLINKACRSAVATGLCEMQTGVPKPEFYPFYISLAEGKPGLIIMEHAFVADRGWAGHSQLGIQNDDMIQYHQKVIQMMKEKSPDVKVCCQLAHAGTHGGAQNKLDLNTATKEELQEVVQQFKAAGERALKAGYDCMQIHSAHTYLLSQSISNMYNHRTDEYKASDFLLLKQVFEAVKSTGGMVGVKLQTDDFAEEGMNAEQTCKIVAEIPFDFVEISGGGNGNGHKYGTIRPGKDVYYYKHVMEALKQHKLIEKQPIIITGGFENLETAKQGLEDGATLVGFGRKFLRNDKFLYDGDAKKCFRCNMCITGLVKGSCAMCPHHLKEQKKE